MRLQRTNRFKRDFKRMKKRGKDERKLARVIRMLFEGKELPQKYQDHILAGPWQDRKECHIEPDWLLIYCVRDDILILERTGSHSDLFK